MVVAIFNNLPELLLGAVWTSVAFAAGMKFGRWKANRTVKDYHYNKTQTG